MIAKRNEAALKTKLGLEFKKLEGFVWQRHEDVRTAGIPDGSLTGWGLDSWIEVKHGTPDFDSTGIQELTMLRLARAGYARYVIYLEEQDCSVRRTLIVHPKNLKSLDAEVWLPGFDHERVAEFFRRRHKGV
jgi:CRISPR/Cas system-associated exonuclease Cas4 (RecB family)